MGTITIAQVCDGLADEVRDVTGIARVASFDQLTEAIHDYPMAMVYASDGLGDGFTQNDRSTMGGVVRVRDWTIVLDIHTSPAAHMAQNQGETVTLTDRIVDLLEEQAIPPYFGVAGIRNWRYRWRLANFLYGAVATRGVQFTLEVRTW